MRLTEIEAARRAFLLVLAQRQDTPVSRAYLAEKVEYIYRCSEAWEVRNILDLPSQRKFDNILDEGMAPRQP